MMRMEVRCPGCHLLVNQAMAERISMKDWGIDMMQEPSIGQYIEADQLDCGERYVTVERGM
jgi:hypothetical protein